MATNITRGFEAAINWLELDTPLPDGVIVTLMDRFAQAVEQPNTYLAFWNSKNVVQVIGGMVVATPIPHDARIDNEMDAIFGDASMFLGMPHHGSVFLHNASDGESQKLRAEVAGFFDSVPEDRRMRFGA